MASGCPRQGLSLSQRPRHLLTQVGGRRRSPHPKEKDDVQGSSEENRLPKKFTSVHDEPASTDKSGSSDDSDGGRTSRANIGRSQFLQSKASAKSSARERQKPEQTINRPQKRSTASSSSTRNAPVASAAKRRKRAVSDISDGDEDEDDDKSRAKGRLTSSGTSARSSSSKPPPSSSSGSHCQDEHGFVKSRQRPQQRTFGGNKTGVKASSGREKASKTEPKGKSTFHRPDAGSDDVPDTPKKEEKFKGLDEPESSNAESPQKRFNNDLPRSDGFSPGKRSANKTERTPRPKSKKMDGQRKPKVKRKRKPQKDDDDDEEPTPKAVFKSDFDTQGPGPEGEEGDVDVEEDFSASERDEKDDAQDNAPQFQALGGSEDDDPTPASLCPWCGEPVDEELLKKFSKGERMNVRMQTRFCQKHKKHTAMEAWESKAYPTIDWDGLPQRIETHHDSLLDIVDGQESYYRSRLAERINAGEARSMKKEDNLNPGYYGPRGFNLMCDRLVHRFSDLLKEKAVKDRVISGRGSAAFIQSVLVAELATLLIMEDMGVPYDEARDIMEESKAIGEIVWEEN